MKIANADKLKHHFEHVVMVKTFTVPEILTIIDTFSREIPEGVWIPIEYRPGTEEEYAEFSKFGTCPRSEFKVYTNEMPEDGQDVLITTKWGTVCEDTYHDEVDASYFEDHDDPDDVIAWMPKPKAYIGGTEP